MKAGRPSYTAISLGAGQMARISAARCDVSIAHLISHFLLGAYSNRHHMAWELVYLPVSYQSHSERQGCFLSRAIRVNQIGSATGHVGKAAMAPSLDVECDRGN